MKSAGIFHIITEWLLLFFPKFRSHRVKNEKLVTAKCSSINDGATFLRAKNEVSI